jgi:hypothetical protein
MGTVDILRLKPAFNDEQAEALARLIDENLATKQDIAEVKRDIEALRVELKRDIESLRKDMTESLDSRAKDLQLEIEKVRSDVTRWVVGMGFATIGVLFALIRFFV